MKRKSVVKTTTLYNCQPNLYILTVVNKCTQALAMANCPGQQAITAPYENDVAPATLFQAKHGFRVDIENSALKGQVDLSNYPLLFNYYISLFQQHHFLTIS